MGEMTDIAMKLRDEFDSRAATLDREGGVPTENYERLRESGYLKAPVPTELGGLGVDIVEFATAQRALGWGCASTALTVNMHLFQVGGAAQGWHASGANEAPLRKVAEEGIVLGSTAAEAVVAGEWDTATTAVADGDDYVVNGRKFFCSGAELLDLVRVNARDTETGEILVVAIPATAPGVEVVHTWDTLGMRGTGSNDLVLDNVRVPKAAVGARLPASAPAWHPGFATVIRWFLSGATGVYVGIADRAREAGHDAIGRGSNSSFRDDALTDMLVGEMEAAHFRASAMFENGLQRIAGALSPIDSMAAAIVMKEEATRAAAETVEAAVEVAGGRSFFRTSVLERLSRDVRAARHHPPSAPVSYQMVGLHASGRTPTPSV
jgi:alkylation response protein AidB-like acyl-CoA dehydrogenase